VFPQRPECSFLKEARHHLRALAQTELGANVNYIGANVS
jgi:hypothetical protein